MSAARLKVAVVGASISDSPDGRERFAIRAQIPALKALPDLYEIVAVCTTKKESAEASARRFQVPHAFDSVERMLVELPEIDIVVVCVRPSIQHQVVMAALRAGKHVYCEYPLGISTAQAQEMYELAKQKNVRTAVGHQMHYEPAVLQMMEMIREGYIGSPLSFNITYLTSGHIAPRPANRSWVFQAELSGHSGFRSGHTLERLISVLGDVTEICADTATLVPECPSLEGRPPMRNTVINNLNFLMRVGGNVMGTAQISLTAWFGTGWGFQVYGTEGMLMLAVKDRPGKKEVKGDPGLGELTLYGNHVDMKHLMANPTAPELLQRQYKEIPPADRHIYVKGIERTRDAFAVAQAWHAFAVAIRGATEFSPSFRDQLKIYCVWDAVEQSMRDRRWSKVDYSRAGTA